MRILIATGIFPPDIGGPAQYAKKLAQGFVMRGDTVHVVTYASKMPYEKIALTQDGEIAHAQDRVLRVSRVSRALPSGLRHAWYAILCLWNILRLRIDVVVILDTFSAAVPAVFACLLTRTKNVFRVGGDFLWEQCMERSLTDLPLHDFYKQELPRGASRIFGMTRWVLQHAAHVVFSTAWQQEIFQKNYALNVAKTSVVMNPHEPETSLRNDIPFHERNAMVFAGRFIRLKNIPRLIRAFERAAASTRATLHLIGEGPQDDAIKKHVSQSPLRDRIHITRAMPKHELLETIARARVFVLPSLSEVSPNLLFDCVHAGTPFIATRETGWRELLSPHALLFDPLKEDELVACLTQMEEEKTWQRYHDRLPEIARSAQQSWDDFINQMHAILKNVCAL